MNRQPHTVPADPETLRAPHEDPPDCPHGLPGFLAENCHQCAAETRHVVADMMARLFADDCQARRNLRRNSRCARRLRPSPLFPAK